jgi:hypothetical protein
MTVVARNVGDFKPTGVALINPWLPATACTADGGLYVSRIRLLTVPTSDSQNLPPYLSRSIGTKRNNLTVFLTV